MVPTPVKQKISLALDPRPLSASPWRLMPDEALSQMPWRSANPTAASPSPSPPRPPPPTRPPPPIPISTKSPDTAITEKFPEPELPPNVLAQLVASLQGGKDINNLKQALKSESTGFVMETQPSPPEAGLLLEHYPPPQSLQKINTPHSHHSSKNSAGHSYAFAVGRSHKASLTSTGSISSRRMTTEEKMSEVDEFFGLDGDDDGMPVVPTASVAGWSVAGEALVEGAQVDRHVGVSDN
ncbi:hypothetical protein CONLIGDRAFT_399505 [Coniochaeta ligniaria NRRL 30616]|uniref:Uncharacterized protein n=1 Tax=Coniochaeta ligniaria NRRL 30616 TaxID=1408157 RepID=A0A1J7IP07_9PEZI|nr:hypothetical protein CONLIGDRAFT_399505 [Coniochaeta ligniaria NRRL 30616]